MTLTGSFGRAVLALMPLLSIAQVAHAQERRAALVDSARRMADDFNERQSIGYLQRALDPALGAPDATWSAGVQLLAQILLRNGQRDEAVAWLRWAVRQSPGMQVDSVNVIPTAVAAFQEARAFVAGTPTGDRVWVAHEWSTATTSGGFGDLRVERAAGEDVRQLQVAIDGGGFVDPGQPRRLAPGSYRIAARATGGSSGEVTAEVLPGVTTVVTFRLDPVVAVADTAAAAPPPAVVAPPTATPRPADTAAPARPAAEPAKKGRSKLIPILGGLAAGGLVAVLAGGGGPDKPRTGGITIRLPSLR